MLNPKLKWQLKFKKAEKCCKWISKACSFAIYAFNLIRLSITNNSVLVKYAHANKACV